MIPTPNALWPSPVLMIVLAATMMKTGNKPWLVWIVIITVLVWEFLASSETGDYPKSAPIGNQLTFFFHVCLWVTALGCLLLRLGLFDEKSEENDQTGDSNQ